jgi:hypothetical protein
MHRMPVHAASGRSPREWLPVLILALLLASAANADVVIKEKTVSEGFGGFGGGTTNRTMIVAGDKSRSEDEVTYTGRFKSLAGGKPHTSVAITRVDKEVIWNLDLENKQYTELSFAEMRKMVSAGTAEGGEPKDDGVTFTVSEKRTGESQNVNGFPAEHVIITAIGKPKNPEKGAEDSEMRLVMDEWLTKSAPGSQEITAYYKLFTEKLGVDMQSSGISPMAQRMYGNGMKEMAAKLKDVGGFPVRSTFTLEGTAGTPPQAAAAKEGQQAQSTPGRERAKEAEASAGKRQDAEDAADLGSSGLSGKIGGFLGRKAARSAQKKTEEKSEKKAEEMSSSGSGAATGGPMMKVVTEVVGISTSAAPAGSFEIPAGYKLKK